MHPYYGVTNECLCVITWQSIYYLLRYFTQNHKNKPAGGARIKVRRSLTLLGFILWETWCLNIGATHLTVVNTFHKKRKYVNLTVTRLCCAGASSSSHWSWSKHLLLCKAHRLLSAQTFFRRFITEIYTNIHSCTSKHTHTLTDALHIV